MPVSAPVGYPTNYKVPGIRIAVNLGVGSKSSGGAARKLLLIGNKLATGSMADNTPTFCPSPDDAAALTGAGSELHQGALAVFAQYTRPNLWLMSNAENGAAVAATATLLFAGTITVAGTLDVRINGRYIDQIVVATTDTGSTIATRVAAAINRKTNWNVTASPTTGTVTITLRNKGPRGNNTSVRAESTATGLTIALNGGTPAASVSGRAGTGTATPGSGADDIQAALDAIFPKKYDRIAIAHTDSANIGKVKAHVNSAAAIMEGRRQQFLCATITDLATATTLATGQNAAREEIIWHYNGDQTTMEIAAQIMCARLYGDGAVGGGIGRRKGEETLSRRQPRGLHARVDHRADRRRRPAARDRAVLGAGQRAHTARAVAREPGLHADRSPDHFPLARCDRQPELRGARHPEGDGARLHGGRPGVRHRERVPREEPRAGADGTDAAADAGRDLPVDGEVRHQGAALRVPGPDGPDRARRGEPREPPGRGGS
jgi:hypothetical protein